MKTSIKTSLFYLVVVVLLSATQLHAQSNTFPSSGNVGIGTNNPRANLDVGGFILNGKIGTILGRLPEGNDISTGTFLGIQGHNTQGSDINNIKSFSLIHNFYGETNSSVNFFRGGSTTGGFLTFNTGTNVERMRINNNGNVGIGTTTPSHKLSVAGTINSEEIIVEENVGADFVFEASYDLPSLQDIEAFIGKNQHLPGIAPASQMIEEGVKVGELQMQLLQKIEELTLYVIEINKENKALAKKNHQLEQRIKQLEHHEN